MAKTPYKNKSDSQRVRYEAVSAALVLTQVDTLLRTPQVLYSVCRSRVLTWLEIVKEWMHGEMIEWIN